MGRRSSLLLLAAATPFVMAQSCISLSGSTTCPAFNASSVSTDSDLVGLFPFLAYVSNTQDFDNQMNQYLTTTYPKLKYQELLGCSDVDLTNTSDLYARYTRSVVCNAIIQNSKTPCSLSSDASRPLCADSCADNAQSEEEIAMNNATCGTAGPNAISQIRADFTNCALPADSLSGVCITGADNEPDNCGYASNLEGLCSYCAASSPNATDSCCVNSNVTDRCTNVQLPTTTSMPPLFTSTSTSAPASSSTGAASSSHHGLTGGQIAGAVVGSVLGAALIAGLIFLCCLYFGRRRQGSQQGSVFNRPSPPRKSAASAMAFQPHGAPQQGYEILPGGRIARMSALEAPRGGSPTYRGPVPPPTGSDGHGLSSSDEYSSPESRTRIGRGALAPQPAGRRAGSLSSSSMLAGGEDPTSPRSGSGNEYSSPQGVSSQQSEQLPFFKDYYSQDEIHPGDMVATLWAYQPRAADEFELERGDMLKVVGIWDDGWATGIRVNQKVEEWEAKKKSQRDSGVSNGSVPQEESPPRPGEIKAFPLVCVCLPEHWRRTIEGDSSTDTGSPGRHALDT